MVLGQEDCLYLNVFTKEVRYRPLTITPFHLPLLQIPAEHSVPKPVMVFIHGGGFLEGSSRTDLYGPEFLMTEDIVLVTINYRLGMLGML